MISYKTKQILKRFSEPSTYAGLAGLAVILGIEAGEWQGYVNAIAAVFGFIAIIVGEGKS